MTNQCGDSHFREPEIISDAREAVAQDMRRDKLSGLAYY
jgi:hypothetical protein